MSVPRLSVPLLRPSLRLKRFGYHVSAATMPAVYEPMIRGKPMSCCRRDDAGKGRGYRVPEPRADVVLCAAVVIAVELKTLLERELSGMMDDALP